MSDTSIGGASGAGTPREWEADRPLTIEIACTAIGDAFPDVDVRDLRHLGSGWEFDAYLSADGWVFRFPRRKEAERLFDVERPILELVRPGLRAGTVVPLVERTGRPGPAFPYAFAGHRFIDGVPADAVSLDLPELASSIGAALGAVHSIPLEEARAAGAVEMHSYDPAGPGWIGRCLGHASKLVDVDPVVGRAVAWVRALADPLRRLDRAPLRLTHNDLAPEHVLVDPTTGRVTGIIDWTDAALADPARDLVFVVTFGGWGFLEVVLACYPLSLDAGFRDRLRFLARLLTVMWLGEVHEKGEDVSKHVEWVRNAFSE